MHKFIPILLSVLFLTACAPQAEETAATPKTIEVIDIAGQTVTLQEPAQRIILGEGRFISAIGILDKEDPTKRVVGMMGEFQKYDPDGYAQLAAAFPSLNEIEIYGSAQQESVSIEKLISLKPDLAVFGLSGHGPGSKSKEILTVLEKAGIPVAFIDFRDNPLQNTTRSIEILGTLMGKEERAKAFVDYYTRKLTHIETSLKEAKPTAPSVFLESHVGLTPEGGRTMAHGMMGHLLDAAGGANIAKDILTAAHGTMNWEYLIDKQPTYYIGTAIGSKSSADVFPTRIALGAGISTDEARASFQNASQQTNMKHLTAVKEGRAFAVWHHFYNSPLNIAALEAMAKFLHPNVFEKTDPEATLEELYAQFQPIPLNGTYWITLKADE